MVNRSSRCKGLQRLGARAVQGEISGERQTQDHNGVQDVNCVEWRARKDIACRVWTWLKVAVRKQSRRQRLLIRFDRIYLFC